MLKSQDASHVETSTIGDVLEFELFGRSDGVPAIAYVPNERGGKYAGYLYLLAGVEGPVLGVPGIVGGIDDSEPDSASAEALIGSPLGPWEQRTDGWYAEIRCFPAHLETLGSPAVREAETSSRH